MTRYVKRRLWVVNSFGLLSFLSIATSTSRFVGLGSWLIVFLVPLSLLACSVAAQLQASIGSSDLDLEAHRRLVSAWEPAEYPTVDVLLPICGEDPEVLQNTWRHVAALDYPNVRGYVLDDRPAPGTRELAEEFGLTYLSRPNPGWFSKAGNLRYGYEQTDGEFILVLDADFCPRPDMLQQTLPYLDADPGLGILQTPQYFDTNADQGWLERGAGAVQEMFYRVIQVSRQHCDAAICVGTNAIYRRAALDANGGPALVRHSEDVHTGFDLRRRGWPLRYVPLNLAAGLCPDGIGGFFRQQYRWCAGSLSLLSSAKFWDTKLPLRTRLCYLSGFFYYLYTAMLVVLLPLMPGVMLGFFPQHVRLVNYLVLAPALIWNYLLVRRWHVSSYRLETSSVRIAYGWAHLFAIVDLLRGHPMQWTATGARASDRRSALLFAVVVVWGVGGGLVLVGAALWRILGDHYSALQFAPLLCLSLLYLYLNLQLAGACLAERSAAATRLFNTMAQRTETLRAALTQAPGQWRPGRAFAAGGGLATLAVAAVLVQAGVFAPPARSSGILRPNHQLLGVATDDAEYASWDSALGGNVSIRMQFISWGYNDPPSEVLDGPGIPMITWQPWKPTPHDAPNTVQQRVQPRYSNRTIARGGCDAYLRRWALAIKAYGKPVIIRLMHEFNGNYYPWYHNPHEFVLAWRHVWDLFHRLGVHNVTWVWSFNAVAHPKTLAKTLNPYWPGRRYVNDIGMTALQLLPYRSTARWFIAQLVVAHRIYRRPTMVTESNAPYGYQVRWLRGVYRSLARMPYNEGFIWSQLPSHLQVTDPAAGDFNWDIRHHPADASILARFASLPYRPGATDQRR